MQRICGVCTTVHAIASVRAVENALELDIPVNAQYIRNMILCAHTLHDHIVHFYHLSALDWVDVVSAAKADPLKVARYAESISEWDGNSLAAFEATQQRLKIFLALRATGHLQQRIWGTPRDEAPARGESAGCLSLSAGA